LAFYVYLLASGKHGRLYIGVTKNLVQEMAARLEDLADRRGESGLDRSFRRHCAIAARCHCQKKRHHPMMARKVWFDDHNTGQLVMDSGLAAALRGAPE
jgi:hypothetical protein